MSDTDSFIDEVNEEVRRDRLYHLLRRYGWIAALAIVPRYRGKKKGAKTKAGASVGKVYVFIISIFFNNAYAVPCIKT